MALVMHGETKPVEYTREQLNERRLKMSSEVFHVFDPGPVKAFLTERGIDFPQGWP